MGALSVRDGGDHRSKKIAPIEMPKAGHWFVPGSPLEGDGFELSVPRYKTMLLDTADPLAGRARRSLRETAPRWDFGYTFVAILTAIACAFFLGMP